MMNTDYKNKKVVAYIALRHHTRFIIPIMEKLEQRGAKILYIVGQAERSQEITAIELGLDFIHICDYTSQKDTEEIEENYRLLRDGFTKGIKSDPALGSSCLMTVLDKTLRAAAQEYVGFKNFFKAENPDVCFALHEVNRWAKTMAFWAKKNNVPVLTLQEGVYNAADYMYIGHVQYSTLNLVWGEKTRNKLSEFEAPLERIIPVGNTHIAREIIRLKENNTRNVKRQMSGIDQKFVILLLFSSKPCAVEDLAPLFTHIADDDSVRLICKFHPVAAVPLIDEWKAKIPESVRTKIMFVHGEESTYVLISASDLCVIAEPGTTGLEALAIGKPLVQLKLSKPDEFPYNFVADKVALHLTPDELVEKLKQGEDISAAFSDEDIRRFIKNELTDTTGAADRIVEITGQVMMYNSHAPIEAFEFQSDSISHDITWSVVILIPDHPEIFLSVLEAVSDFSDNAGSYEVLIVKRPKVSRDIQSILDALEGNVTVVSGAGDGNCGQLMNAGAARSRGQRLVFPGDGIAPAQGWLEHLNTAYDTHGAPYIFGARVVNPHNNIVHAGMVVDGNNTPVPAYLHLDEDFPQVMKTRPFQMLDHFISLNRSVFRELGGFHPSAGRYAFMDLCLRSNEHFSTPKALYVPEIKLIRLSPGKKPVTTDESVYFFSRWHGVLRDSEGALYKADNISQLQLDSARMTRAMKIAGQQESS